MDFQTEPEKILRMLEQSLFDSTLTGIYAPGVLGPGIFITTVEKIFIGVDDTEILLREYDSTGYILAKNQLRLSDIRRACSFSSPMVNPYLKELTGCRFHQIIN